MLSVRVCEQALQMASQGSEARTGRRFRAAVMTATLVKTN